MQLLYVNIYRNNRNLRGASLNTQKILSVLLSILYYTFWSFYHYIMLAEKKCSFKNLVYHSSLEKEKQLSLVWKTTTCFTQGPETLILQRHV